ncbi:MAG: acyl-CoA dehydrogenase family protein, partial [Candidatus Binatia bacterium]
GILRTWQRRLHEGRWLVVHWPEEVGGRGLTMLEHLIVQEELLRAEAPPLINAASLSIVGPTLLTFASDEQKKRHLEKFLSAEEIWCIGFSEPGAGSDLGSVRTRAERRGDVYVLNGQKVWTTYAHVADWGFFLVRTDAALPKHKGLTTLILDMKRPGIVIRPLVEITGDVDFNEVFLDNVEVPAANVIGGENQGWKVILTSLGHERGTLNVVDRVRLQRDLLRLIARARETGPGGRPAVEEPVFRQRIAQSWIEMEIVRLFSIRILSDLERGRPTPDSSVIKLFSSEVAQRMYDVALEIVGPYAQLWRGETRAPDGAAWQHGRLLSFARTIAAGTSEIQRNIIAERILGLPREPSAVSHQPSGPAGPRKLTAES